jgi:hypothetical protein
MYSVIDGQIGAHFVALQEAVIQVNKDEGFIVRKIADLLVQCSDLSVLLVPLASNRKNALKVHGGTWAGRMNTSNDLGIVLHCHLGVHTPADIIDSNHQKNYLWAKS